MTVWGLFHRLALEKNGLLQHTEELLVRTWFFDGLQVELCAGSDDKLGFSAGPDGGGKAHEITAVVERAPCVKIARQEEEGVRAIEEIGRVGAVGLFALDKFLSGNDSQLFIQHFHIEVQVLHSGNDGLEHSPTIRGIKRARLCSSDLELARFR